MTDYLIKKGLSGDSDAFCTEGKSMCRDLWYSYTSKLFQARQRKLDILWLANNQLTDLDPISHLANTFYIPDNNKFNKAAKRKTMLYKYNLPKRNSFFQIDNPKALQARIRGLDIVNLDTCNHLDNETLSFINKLISSNLNKNSYFFATFTKASQRSMNQNKRPDYKRLAGSIESIDNLINTSFSACAFRSKILKGFPITYKTGINRSNDMFSFGWQLTKN